MSAQLQSTAYHEAGHAVAAWALGVPVRSITIVRDGNVSLGSVTYAPVLSKRVLQPFKFKTSLQGIEGETAALRYAVISLAGVVSQRKYAPRSVRRGHARHDYQAVIFSAEQAGCSDEQELKHWYRRALRRAEQLIERKWPAVEAVASALIKKRELSGKEALAAIHSAYETLGEAIARSARPRREKKQRR